jgi:hypothetical protein
MSAERGGQVWLQAELEQLRREYQDGMQLEDMMEVHQRTAYGILGKLISMGFLTPDYRPIGQDPWILPAQVKQLAKKGAS